MNIINNDCVREKLSYEQGDTFTDSDGTVYLLALCDGDYYAISLANGHFWRYGNRDATIAVEGLDFLARGAIITISKNRG